MINTVLKVGGSLGQSAKLADLMTGLAELGPKHGLMIVPGGGAFADAIRYYDRRFGLDKDTAHWMAILAMDQYGYLISSLAPKIQPVHGLADARTALSSGFTPVLLTYNLLFQADELPRTWDVTSDSIAAWVAGLAGASRLVLLKSLDGLFNRDPAANPEAELLKEISPERMTRSGVVDPYLASILEKRDLDMWVINGKRVERVTQLLETGMTKGTHLRKLNT